MSAMLFLCLDDALRTNFANTVADDEIPRHALKNLGGLDLHSTQLALMHAHVPSVQRKAYTTQQSNVYKLMIP